MITFSKLFTLIPFLLAASVEGFAPEKQSTIRSRGPLTTSTELKALPGQHVAASLIIATGLLFSVVDEPVVAHDSLQTLPPTLIAARSGGRAGGRAYRAPAAAVRPSTTTNYRSTTIVRPMIAAPPIVVSPFGGYGYGYGYSSPMNGFGLGYGLGAMNSAGDAIRDYRQESEIQRERAELELEKQKSADLEARIKQLEAAQAGASK